MTCTGPRGWGVAVLWGHPRPPAGGASRNLTALHELYGFCFQGHLRGGGRSPSSLLGLSGVQGPSATLSLVGAGGEEESHGLLTDGVPAGRQGPHGDGPARSEAVAATQTCAGGPLEPEIPGQRLFTEKPPQTRGEHKSRKAKPVPSGQRSGAHSSAEAPGPLRTGPETLPGPTCSNSLGLAKPFLRLAQGRSVSQGSVRRGKQAIPWQVWSLTFGMYQV